VARASEPFRAAIQVAGQTVFTLAW